MGCREGRPPHKKLSMRRSLPPSLSEDMDVLEVPQFWSVAASSPRESKRKKLKWSVEPTDEKNLGSEPSKKKSTVTDLHRSVKIGQTFNLSIHFTSTSVGAILRLRSLECYERAPIGHSYRWKSLGIQVPWPFRRPLILPLRYNIIII